MLGASGFTPRDYAVRKLVLRLVIWGRTVLDRTAHRSQVD